MRARQDMDDDPVDQQDVEQDRDIAGEFDNAINDVAGDPVIRQPDNAEQETENGCRDDPEEGDQGGVQDTHQHGPEMGALRRVFDQPLVDVVGRGEAQEIEAEGLAENRQVEHRVVDDVGQKREQQGHGQDLQDDRARILVAPQPEQKIGLASYPCRACPVLNGCHPCPQFMRPYCLTVYRARAPDLIRRPSIS